MATLFISDLHLEPQKPAIVQAFVQFATEKTQHIDALYILGDFFEAWIGDDFENAFADALKNTLKSISSRGVPVFFMHGNRDFLIGELFAEQTGCTLLPDPTIIDLYGTPTLLMHGDTLCTDDIAYQQFRTMVRNPNWQQELLSKSIAERLAIAQNLRDISKEKTSEKTAEIMDVNPDEVLRVMEQYQVQRLIHGHTHRPATHQLIANGLPAQRTVLGDWGSDGWYLKVSKAQTDLLDFVIA